MMDLVRLHGRDERRRADGAEREVVGALAPAVAAGQHHASLRRSARRNHLCLTRNSSRTFLPQARERS